MIIDLRLINSARVFPCFKNIKNYFLRLFIITVDWLRKFDDQKWSRIINLEVKTMELVWIGHVTLE